MIACFLVTIASVLHVSALQMNDDIQDVAELHQGLEEDSKTEEAVVGAHIKEDELHIDGNWLPTDPQNHEHITFHIDTSSAFLSPEDLRQLPGEDPPPQYREQEVIQIDTSSSTQHQAQFREETQYEELHTDRRLLPTGSQNHEDIMTQIDTISERRCCLLAIFRRWRCYLLAIFRRCDKPKAQEHSVSNAFGDCQICLEDFADLEKGSKIVLNCHKDHAFHKDCIKEWASKSKRNCPVCRSPIKQIQLEELGLAGQAEVGQVGQVDRQVGQVDGQVGEVGQERGLCAVYFVLLYFAVAILLVILCCFYPDERWVVGLTLIWSIPMLPFVLVFASWLALASIMIICLCIVELFDWCCESFRGLITKSYFRRHS